MKIKILESSGWYKHFVGSEFEFVQYEVDDYLGIHIENTGWIYRHHCVITELPESFCVKRCDDKENWKKYIVWLNKTYDTTNLGKFVEYLGYYTSHNVVGSDKPLGTEIHIDDMIKHIDYMERHIKGGEQFHKESQLIAKMDKILKEEEFDLTTNEGRLAYARKHYPIGTKYVPLYSTGESWDNIKTINYNTELLENGTIDGGFGFVYANGKWGEIVKEEVNMETQKLSRIGLEEIHSVACTSWKKTLVDWAKNRNIFKEYIELSQEEVNQMFDACTKDQLPIVSKYLKQDDGSVDVMKFKCEIYDEGGRAIIEKRCDGEYAHKSLLLEDAYNWKIKRDSKGKYCLIPTKKK